MACRPADSPRYAFCRVPNKSPMSVVHGQCDTRPAVTFPAASALTDRKSSALTTTPPSHSGAPLWENGANAPPLCHSRLPVALAMIIYKGKGQVYHPAALRESSRVATRPWKSLKKKILFFQDLESPWKWNRALKVLEFGVRGPWKSLNFNTSESSLPRCEGFAVITQLPNAVHFSFILHT